MGKWQDVFSVDDWIKIVNESETFINSLDSDSKQIIDQLSVKLTSYHRIDKANIKKFSERKQLLSEIKELANDYIQKRGEMMQYKTPGNKKMLKNGIDLFITSLLKRTVKKSAYLDLLVSHNEQMKKKYKHKQELIAEIHKRSTRTALQQTDFKVFGGTILEKIDPAHRQFEFSGQHLNLKSSEIDLAMNKAFFEWASGKDDMPFFIWLEAHPTSKPRIFTPSNVLTRLSKNSPNAKVRSIHYDVLDALTIEINHDNKLIISDLPAEKTKPLNTPTMKHLAVKLGCPTGAAAFIWDKKNINKFITHAHSSGEYHHTSITKGKKVRGAGMWLVKDGLVEYISNASGHYHPTSLNFYILIRFLMEKNVLSPSVVISDVKKPREPEDLNAPMGRMAPLCCSLQQYLDWAEKLSEVTEYLENLKKEQTTLQKPTHTIRS